MSDCIEFPAPILILGIMHRSGTNFLHQLICLHPGCVSSVLWEDFFIHPAPLLEAYAHAVYSEWIPLTREKLEPVIKSPIDSLLHHLGNGLLSFLYTQNSKSQRLVAKTPWVRNLSYVFRLFPNAQILLLVRDGRSVVESGVTSFYWDETSAMHQWAQAAQEILQFQQDYSHLSDQYLVLKYEDLYLNTVEAMTKILNFLNLDLQHYDFSKALDTPVIGSSDLRREQGQYKIHWQPVEKTGEFQPLNRWENWSDAKHSLFNKIAGQQMLKLGYTLQETLMEETEPKMNFSTDFVDNKNGSHQHRKNLNDHDKIVKQILEKYQAVLDNSTQDNFYY
jgi:hypothetical protein